jgi:hypothetical protein
MGTTSEGLYVSREGGMEEGAEADWSVVKKEMTVPSG